MRSALGTSAPATRMICVSTQERRPRAGAGCLLVSATSTSPFGSTWSQRGWSSPWAKAATASPGAGTGASPAAQPSAGAMSTVGRSPCRGSGRAGSGPTPAAKGSPSRPPQAARASVRATPRRARPRVPRLRAAGRSSPVAEGPSMVVLPFGCAATGGAGAVSPPRDSSRARTATGPPRARCGAVRRRRSRRGRPGPGNLRRAILFRTGEGAATSELMLPGEGSETSISSSPSPTRHRHADRLTGGPGRATEPRADAAIAPARHGPARGAEGAGHRRGALARRGRRTASARRSGVRLWGGPIRLPSARTRARPARARPTRRSRSNSATASITPMVGLPVDEVRSTPPRARQGIRTPRPESACTVAASVHRVAPRPVEPGDGEDVALLQAAHQPREAAPPRRGRARHGLGHDAARVDGEARARDLARPVVGGPLGGGDPEAGDAARHGARRAGSGKPGPDRPAAAARSRRPAHNPVQAGFRAGVQEGARNRPRPSKKAVGAGAWATGGEHRRLSARSPPAQGRGSKAWVCRTISTLRPLARACRHPGSAASTGRPSARPSAMQERSARPWPCWRVAGWSAAAA